MATISERLKTLEDKEKAREKKAEQNSCLHNNIKVDIDCAGYLSSNARCTGCGESLERMGCGFTRPAKRIHRQFVEK